MQNDKHNISPSDEQVPPAVKPEESTHGRAQQPCRARRRCGCDIDDEQRHDLHCAFNDRISNACKLAALVIAVVAFGSMVLGQDDIRFVLMGLCLSVALLAIALLQESYQRRR